MQLLRCFAALALAPVGASLVLSSCAGDVGAPPDHADGTTESPLDALTALAKKTPASETDGCLDGITDYDSPGPFRFDTDNVGLVKMWIPRVPAGCKVPVIHLANGTTASCILYGDAIERLASHGFLTTCYEDSDTGAGQFGLQAFQAALEHYPDLADNKLGSTGHSQGGQAALVTQQLAEAKWGDKMIYAALAMEPASGFGDQPLLPWQIVYSRIKSPVFMFSGTSSTGFASSLLLGLSVGDGLVGTTWVQEGYEALNKSVEAYHWTAIGATHIPTPQVEEQQVSIPWFRWKLLGDTQACRYFKGLTDGLRWQPQAEQNVAPCE